MRVEITDTPFRTRVGHENSVVVLCHALWLVCSHFRKIFTAGDRANFFQAIWVLGNKKLINASHDYHHHHHHYNALSWSVVHTMIVIIVVIIVATIVLPYCQYHYQCHCHYCYCRWHEPLWLSLPLFAIVIATVFVVTHYVTVIVRCHCLCSDHCCIECVHMTSRRPCWRSKQKNGGHLGGVKYSFGD